MTDRPRLACRQLRPSPRRRTPGFVASISWFLKCGHVGPIKIGMTRAQVRGLLGLPQDWMSGAPCGFSGVWLYKSIEVGFGDVRGARDQVIYLQIEHIFGSRGRFKGAARLLMRDGAFSPKLSNVLDFQRFARKTGVALSPITLGDNQFGFVTPGGVNVWFDDDDGSRSPESRLANFITGDVGWFVAKRLPLGFLAPRNRLNPTVFHPGSFGIKTRPMWRAQRLAQESVEGVTRDRP